MKTKELTHEARNGAILRPTLNNLPAATRAQVVAILNCRLADTIDLFHQAKQAHWNVKGRNFIALHQLFDQVAAAAEEFMDVIAERAAQLGGIAEGTIQTAAQRTKLAEYPMHLRNEQEHIRALSTGLAAYGSRVRKAIDESDDLGDKDTADIFTEVSRGADKYLWFVESHIDSEQERDAPKRNGAHNTRRRHDRKRNR